MHTRADIDSNSPRVTRLLAAGLAVLVLTLFGSAAAQAATFDVTLTSDASGTCTTAGPCTLRQAIASAAAGDTVSVPAGTYGLTAAAGGTIVIGRSITIAGPNGGAASVVIDGHSAGGRILEVGAGTKVAIQDVTLTNGQSSDSNGGSAILVDNGATPVPAGCPGSVSDPRAASGNLCIFEADNLNATRLGACNVESTGCTDDAGGIGTNPSLEIGVWIRPFGPGNTRFADEGTCAVTG
jgi:hypothetical protein